MVMKLLLILAIALVPLGCHSGVSWPPVVQCGSEIGNLVGTITQILLSDTATTDGGAGALSEATKQKLTQLAEQFGIETVLCVVDHLLQDWTSPAASPNPDRARGADRARAFLAYTGTHVEHRAP